MKSSREMAEDRQDSRFRGNDAIPKIRWWAGTAQPAGARAEMCEPNSPDQPDHQVIHWPERLKLME